MPLPVRLSREFYDRFGDKIVDELVGLLQEMGTTVRGELRELNDLNYQRFEASLDGRLRALEARLDGKVDRLATELRAEMAAVAHRVVTRMAELKAELIKWMFLFWLGTVATMLGFGRFLIS